MSVWHFDYDVAPKGVKVSRDDARRIFRYLLPAWQPSLLIITCILLTSLLGLIPPLLVRELIDKALPARDGARLNWLIAGMIGAPLLAGLIGVWQNYLVTVMGQSVMFEMRNDMYDRLLRQSLRFFCQRNGLMRDCSALLGQAF